VLSYEIMSLSHQWNGVQPTLERSDDARQSPEAGQHPARTASIGGIEQLGRGGVQDGIEVLQGVSMAWGRIIEIMGVQEYERHTVCIIYSRALRPT
jgi:hypothetical protein